MSSLRRAALLLVLIATGVFIFAGAHFGDPFASLGAVWFDLHRASLMLFQRAIFKFEPALWTFAIAPLLRLPLGLIILIPAAELFAKSRKP